MRLLFVYKKPSIDIRDPLGLLHVISAAKEAGHRCSLLIYDLEERFFEKAVKFKPDVVCYSVTTGTEKAYLRINSQIKEKMSFFSLFGGPHPTFYPDFIEESGVDGICRGESEGSFKRFLDRLEGGKNIFDTPNFWFKKEGGIIKNELGPLPEDLDNIAFPDRELIDRYWDYKNYGRIDVLSGRGCPFDCSYCFNHKMKEYYAGKGRYVRKRSVGNVISEVKINMDRYGIKEVFFADDLFIIDKRWLTEFAGRYPKEAGLPYTCNIRANIFTDETAKCLKESNCRFVGFAIESGNYHLRKVLNREMSNDQIYAACELLRKHKIRFGVGNMLGLPYETIDNAFETVRLNIKCRPNHAWVSILQPYPNTELYDFSIKNNLLKDGCSIDPDIHTSSPFKSKYSTQLENLHDLFAICVDFPFMIPIVKKIIKLPRSKLFEMLHDAYKFYSYIRIGQIKPRYALLKNSLKMYYLKMCNAVKGI